MTTKIKASVVDYVTAMTAGTISLTDSVSNTPNTGTLKFGNNSLSLTGGDGNNFKFNGADLYVGTNGDKNVYAYSFSGTATYATKVVASGGNQTGNLTFSYSDAAFGGTPTYVLGSSNGTTYGQYSPSNFTANKVANKLKASGYLSGSDYDGSAEQTWSVLAGAAATDTGKLAVRDSNGDLFANTFHGNATSANYADLAEKYLSDDEYQPGTVVSFGGDKEITITTAVMDSAVAGVISTNPAYMMNSELQGGLYVALTGRVPCRVIGPIKKGDLMVSSGVHGVATAWTNVNDTLTPGSVIGKALENYDDPVNVGVIEVVVGRV
jgi:hypothetical protein